MYKKKNKHKQLNVADDQNRKPGSDSVSGSQVRRVEIKRSKTDAALRLLLLLPSNSSDGGQHHLSFVYSSVQSDVLVLQKVYWISTDTL